MLRTTVSLNINSIILLLPDNFLKFSENPGTATSTGYPKGWWVGKCDRKKVIFLRFLFLDLKLTWMQPAWNGFEKFMSLTRWLSKGFQKQELLCI